MLILTIIFRFFLSFKGLGQNNIFANSGHKSLKLKFRIDKKSPMSVEYFLKTKFYAGSNGKKNFFKSYIFKVWGQITIIRGFWKESLNLVDC